jgi:thymidylate kinase
MALRIFFAGTEGAGKTSCIEALAGALAADHRVLLPTPEAPVLLLPGERRALLGPGWSRAHRRAREVARRLHVYPLFLGPNFALRALLAHWFEARLRPDLSLYDGDLLAHPVAYARYHFAPARWLSPELALRVAAACFGVGRRATIFHLDRAPAAAAARIEARGDSEKHVGPPRDLDRLKVELELVAEAARKLGYEVVRIDTGERSPEEIAREIEGEVRRRLRA